LCTRFVCLFFQLYSSLVVVEPLLLFGQPAVAMSPLERANHVRSELANLASCVTQPPGAWACI
jgi:hypothetical protein